MPGEDSSIFINWPFYNAVNILNSVGQEDVFDVREQDLDRFFVQ